MAVRNSPNRMAEAAGRELSPTTTQAAGGLNILVLTPSLPYPPIWGFGIRVYQFLRLLSRNNRVSLLTFAGPNDGERICHLETVCDRVYTVQTDANPERDKRRSQLRSLLSPASYQRRSLTTPAMQRKLDEICTRERFDVIQIESSQLAGYRLDPAAITALDEHNIEYELLYRMCAGDSSLPRRVYNWLEYRKFRGEETRSWREASGCIMTSEREQEIVQARVPTKPVTTVPNAVDIDFFRPAESTADPNNIVMTGLMRYRPNSDAAIYFIREVLPLITSVRPKLTFYVVGAGPPEELKRLAGPNVVVTDMVPDVRPFVHNAGVFVVPLRMGSGTRLKVLEGLAMQKAMVSTALGCEGIDVQHESHLLVADEPAAFAQSVLRLLDDADLSRRLGANGRRLVEERYSWETVVEELERFYGRLLDGRQTASAE